MNNRLVGGFGCVLVVSVGLLAGCGDDTGSSSATQTTSASATTASGTASNTDATTEPGTGTGQPTTGGSNSGTATDSGTTDPGTTSASTTSASTTSASTTSATTGGSESTSTDGTASTTTTTGGILFDVGVDTTTGDPPPPPPLGSCRPSELHGAAGGFPKFNDPAYAPFLDKGVAIVTSNNQGDGWVLHVVDISGPVPPPNINYLAPLYHNAAWTQANIGRVFGLTLDSDGNIYVAPTTVYGGNPSPATIKKIDSVTGQASNFATLPNNGPAFGNINYDCVSETIYASSHEDGRIYQIDMNGQVVSTYRHFDKNVTLGLANDPGEPNGAFIPLGQRVWAVQSHAGRLYYSVWKEDTGRKSDVDSNEIWSVAYVDEGGVPDPATAKLEFLAPAYLGQNYSNPVSDLSFAATGWMLITQRTMINDTQTSAHQSTTYEYQYNQGTWELKGTTYIIGELPGSACGGVDHSFEENGYVWMTGDALDFYTPEVVYGLQGTPHGGGDITNSTLIDMDHEVVNQDKTAMGDVEVPIPGDAAPVPVPQ